MKKICMLALIAALLLSFPAAALAEGGVRMEVITMDGMSVVRLIPEESFGTETGIMLGSSADGFVLPESLTTIGEEAFAGIAAEKVEVSVNVTAIGARAFANCGNLRELYIPENVTKIDDTALSGSDNVTVYGATGSEAHEFATRNNIPFVDPDNPVVPEPVEEPAAVVLPPVMR